MNSFRVQALWKVTGTYYGDLDYIPVRVNYTYLTYNISGYVTNTSSGLPLSGATVQTNTSLSTTTNATGFYKFTGVANGTYIVNASLFGYANNSINVTISGADVTNANISLSPLIYYTLSGHVINATSAAAISGATVTTDTGQTSTTNTTGDYNFTLISGDYLITASKYGYYENYITETVAGADVADIDIYLTPTTGRIFVATNRYVILDDWTTTSSNGPGFSKPTTTHTRDDWTNINTNINATALFIDNRGSPLSGKVIKFNLYMLSLIHI